MREKVGSSYAYDAAAFVPSAVIGSGSAKSRRSRSSRSCAKSSPPLMPCSGMATAGPTNTLTGTPCRPSDGPSPQRASRVKAAAAHRAVARSASLDAVRTMGHPRPKQTQLLARCPASARRSPNRAHSRRLASAAGTAPYVEAAGEVSPPGAPRSVREPLDSYGSRCAAVSMTELPVGEECWIYPA